ncbi:alpha/beta fold hydrolase [Anaerocolumna sp. AGMB13025]|uniref:alpha/beta fold hydrolase n=1 Tax=Anaerocolumna sp. AGMB13025 TaxID=3039116 RepID=UPI00241CBCF3|nr:alpha/beta fold hydrolase [Anaerocolumna sp. AGMB13025]WFR57927.1 alpha/beta fold hydrolase [Anaerocolumna sp. AGMB13025]
MDSNAELIVQKDGYKSILYHFFSAAEPKASIVILHGMAEHHKRYYPFVKFLNANDIDVYLYDHRGHGTDKLMKELGYFSESKGYKKVVEDALLILQHVNQNKRSNKLILMGHSMGSLIARNVIQQYDGMDGVILCGTTHPSRLKTRPGKALAAMIQFLYGPTHRSPFLNTMMFGGKSYSSLITRTSFDWLSRNNPSVGAYIHDPYCGYICTISFYHDLLMLVSNASNTSLMKKTRNSLPILVISGGCDPVGGNGKEVKHMLSLYNKWGYNRVTGKLYPECRHELLQELNADEIMKDIQTWIMKQL